MNFGMVLGVVSGFLEERGYRHAVIGGIALASYGLPRCQRKPGPGGLQVLVPKPEHLAALKVLAMKNDPARIFQEMADIRFLLTVPGVDRHEIRDYFERQGLKERFDELERTL